MNVKKAAIIVLIVCIVFIGGIVAISLNSQGWSWFGFDWGHGNVGGHRIDIDESSRLDLSGAGEVSISLPAGNVTVKVGEPGVTLKGYITTAAEEKDRYLFVTNKDGKLSIEFDIGDEPLIWDNHIEMTVSLPQQLAAGLKISDASGDIRVTGIAMKDLNVTNMSGNMDLQDCTGGALIAELMSGNMTVRNADFTSVDADCQSGNVRIDNKNGPINVQNTSGIIDITAVSGAIDAGNTSGNIDISLSGQQVAAIKAGVTSGNITLRLNQQAAFTLDARTSSGNVGCDFDILVSGGIDRNIIKGDCNGGGALVKLSVDSGNVNVFKG